MTDFARVLRNTGWFLLGNALPILAALLTVPLLIDLLGTTRFGLLTLAWTLVGYFSLFDLGLGRALTKMVAERSQVGPTESRTGGTTADLSTLCSTGLGMVIVLGAVGGVVGPLAILWSDSWFDGVDAGGEELRSVIWIALGIPLVVVTAALRGILEGFQEFRLLALIRAPTGAAMFVVPWLAASIQPTLDWAVAALVLTRLVVLIAHWVPCSRRLHLSLAGVQRRWVRPLVNFGGWLTVINVVGPIVTYADRFVIASMMAAATVAYYTVPFDVVARLMLFPLALSSALQAPRSAGCAETAPEGGRLHGGARVSRGAARCADRGAGVAFLAGAGIRDGSHARHPDPSLRVRGGGGVADDVLGPSEPRQHPQLGDPDAGSSGSLFRGARRVGQEPWNRGGGGGLDGPIHPQLDGAGADTARSGGGAAHDGPDVHR
jgi:hypothetical protein